MTLRCSRLRCRVILPICASLQRESRFLVLMYLTICIGIYCFSIKEDRARIHTTACHIVYLIDRAGIRAWLWQCYSNQRLDTQLSNHERRISRLSLLPFVEVYADTPQEPSSSVPQVRTCKYLPSTLRILVIYSFWQRPTYYLGSTLNLNSQRVQAHSNQQMTIPLTHWRCFLKTATVYRLPLG
jgi:hypothetical protein